MQCNCLCFMFLHVSACLLSKYMGAAVPIWVWKAFSWDWCLSEHVEELQRSAYAGKHSSLCLCKCTSVNYTRPWPKQGFVAVDPCTFYHCALNQEPQEPSVLSDMNNLARKIIKYKQVWSCLTSFDLSKLTRCVCSSFPLVWGTKLNWPDKHLWPHLGQRHQIQNCPDTRFL